jgi:hypothetical protein
MWLGEALKVSRRMVELFWSDETKSFHDTPIDGEQLIVRPHDVTDNALPSGNSLAADLLARLGVLMADDESTRRASLVVDPLAEHMARHPLAFGHLLGVADLLVNGSVELALAGDPTTDDFRRLNAAAGGVYVPALIIAGGRDDTVALLRDRATGNGTATAYVCRSFTCNAPTSDAAELHEQLASAPRSVSA